MDNKYYYLDQIEPTHKNQKLFIRELQSIYENMMPLDAHAGACVVQLFRTMETHGNKLLQLSNAALSAYVKALDRAIFSVLSSQLSQSRALITEEAREEFKALLRKFSRNFNEEYHLPIIFHLQCAAEGLKAMDAVSESSSNVFSTLAQCFSMEDGTFQLNFANVISAINVVQQEHSADWYSAIYLMHGLRDVATLSEEEFDQLQQAMGEHRSQLKHHWQYAYGVIKTLSYVVLNTNSPDICDKAITSEDKTMPGLAYFAALSRSVKTGLFRGGNHRLVSGWRFRFCIIEQLQHLASSEEISEKARDQLNDLLNQLQQRELLLNRTNQSRQQVLKLFDLESPELRRKRKERLEMQLGEHKVEEDESSLENQRLEAQANMAAVIKELVEKHYVARQAQQDEVLPEVSHQLQQEAGFSLEDRRELQRATNERDDALHRLQQKTNEIELLKSELEKKLEVIEEDRAQRQALQERLEQKQHELNKYRQLHLDLEKRYQDELESKSDAEVSSETIDSIELLLKHYVDTIETLKREKIALQNNVVSQTEALIEKYQLSVKQAKAVNTLQGEVTQSGKQNDELHVVLMKKTQELAQQISRLIQDNQSLSQEWNELERERVDIQSEAIQQFPKKVMLDAYANTEQYDEELLEEMAHQLDKNAIQPDAEIEGVQSGVESKANVSDHIPASVDETQKGSFVWEHTESFDPILVQAAAEIKIDDEFMCPLLRRPLYDAVMLGYEDTDEVEKLSEEKAIEIFDQQGSTRCPITNRKVISVRVDHSLRKTVGDLLQAELDQNKDRLALQLLSRAKGVSMPPAYLKTRDRKAYIEQLKASLDEVATYLKRAYAFNTDIAEPIKDYLELSFYRGHGDSWLHGALLAGIEPLVKLFFTEMEVDVNITYQMGLTRTPPCLHYAAEGGHADTCQYLIDLGAEVDALDRGRNTALITAAQNNQLATCQFLLSHGAAVNHENELGQTAWDRAYQFDHEAVCSLLVDHGAKTKEIQKRHKVFDRQSSATELDEDQANEAGGKRLLDAAKLGQLELCKQLLDRGAPIDYQDLNDDGPTPLMRACREGHYMICKLLLERGADINKRVDFSAKGCGDHFFGTKFHTVFVIALRGKDVRLCKLLARYGPAVDQPELSRGFAAKSGSIELCKLIETLGIDLKGRGAVVEAFFGRFSDRGTALHIAAENGHTGLCKFLLDQGLETNSIDSKRLTPFMRAADRGRLEICQLLLDYRAVLDQEDESGRTALGYSRNVDVCKLLLDSGADMCHEDHKGKSVFRYAVSKVQSILLKKFEYYEVADELLARGVDINQLNGDGETALTGCLGDYHSEAQTRYLLKRGADIERPNAKGDTPLLAACKAKFWDEDKKACKVLLEAEANTEARDINGDTPLLVAAKANRSKLCELLLFCNADVEAVDQFGDTALLAAVRTGLADVCRVLLQYGANAQFENANGETAASIAQEEEQVDITHLLANPPARIEVPEQSSPEEGSSSPKADTALSDTELLEARLQQAIREEAGDALSSRALIQLRTRDDNKTAVEGGAVSETDITFVT